MSNRFPVLPAHSRRILGYRIVGLKLNSWGILELTPGNTRRPPHRSLRAELPHKAPASGRNAQTRFIYPLTYPCQRTLQPFPALCPVAGLLARIAFGQPPFLHQLRRRALTPHFVRRFLRYYGFRLLRFVHRLVPRADPQCGGSTLRSPGFLGYRIVGLKLNSWGILELTRMARS